MVSSIHFVFFFNILASRVTIQILSFCFWACSHFSKDLGNDCKLVVSHLGKMVSQFLFNSCGEVFFFFVSVAKDSSFLYYDIKGLCKENIFLHSASITWLYGSKTLNGCPLLWLVYLELESWIIVTFLQFVRANITIFVWKHIFSL